MTRALTNRTVQAAFGAAVAMLLIVGGLAYRSIVVTVESEGWVRHTQEVLENLSKLQLAMETVASSVRGYSLTGAQGYLDAYQAGRLSSDKARGSRPRSDRG